MKNHVTFLLLFFCQVSFGQYSFSSGRSVGLGQTSVTFHDVNSLLGNQAGLAWVENFSVTAAAERRFSLSELSSFSAGIIVPAGHGSFGLLAQTYGFEAFRQQKICLAYARKLWEKFSFGAQFDYLQTRIPEYGSKSAITFEAGIMSKLTDEITLGVHIFSPAEVQFAENEPLPTIFKMGFAWQASENALLVAEVEKDIDFKARVKGGFEYRLVQPVLLRAGFGTNPATFHFGLGFQLNSNLKIDAASSYHQVLGFSPAVAASWSK